MRSRRSGVRREARQEAARPPGAAKADRQQLKDFLADGVITQDEFDKLPADSPLRKMTGLMDDGKITTDELKALGRGFMKGKGNGGHGWLREGQGPGRLAGADGRHQRLTPASSDASARARRQRRAFVRPAADRRTVAFRLRATPGLDADRAPSRILRSLMSHTTVSWLMCMRGRPRRSEDGRRVSPR